MTHLDPEDLALMALAGAAPDATANSEAALHLVACCDCAAELAELRRTVDHGRSAPVRLLSPGPAVWAGIHAELGLSPALAEEPLAPNATANAAGTTVDPTRTDPRSADPAPAHPSAEQTERSSRPTPAPIVSLGDRRRTPGRRRWLALSAAAAAGLIVGVSATLWWPARTAPTAPPLAEATLDPLPGWTASGKASVVRSADGLREVTVTLRTTQNSVDTVEPLREVWLLRPDSSGLVSLGLLTGGAGRFVIPDSLDLGAFPVVDVSAEASDGDPAHSGDSIVRGELTPGERAS